MREIIDWLVHMESSAARIYAKAAERFSSDPELSRFLRDLSEDEDLHHRIIRMAAEKVLTVEQAPAMVYMSDQTRDFIDSYLELFEKRVESKDLTKEKLLGYIIEVEAAEGNDLFLYVVNTLRHDHPEFIPELARIQQHRRRIEAFIEKNPGMGELGDKLRELHPVFEERILVVGGAHALMDTCLAVLDNVDVVDTAWSRDEAINMLSAGDYAAVVVDQKTPGLDPRTFLEEAEKARPGVGKRMLLFSDPEADSIETIRRFCKRSRLRCLEPPVQLGEVRRAVLDTMGAA